MKTIPVMISRKRNEWAEMKVDDRDYVWLSPITWYLHDYPISKTTYARAYFSCRDKQTGIFAHQIIMAKRGIVVSTDKVIDHIDRDGMNNQLSNLRAVTRSVNLRNRDLFDNNTSGFTGVSFCKRRGRFYARVHDDRRAVFCGYHDTAEAASGARDAKLVELGLALK